MPLLALLVLLAGLTSAVAVPVFIGHGLSVGNPFAMLVGVGFGVLAAALLFAHIRWADRVQGGRPTGSSSDH
jgi:hypothetical protein